MLGWQNQGVLQPRYLVIQFLILLVTVMSSQPFPAKRSQWNLILFLWDAHNVVERIWALG